MSYGAIGTIERDSDGKLPSWAWPGGYPILYVDGDNETLCADCATVVLDQEDPFPASHRPTTWFIHYEGPPEYCARCNKEIESAYGDPEEGESDDSCVAAENPRE